MASRQLVGAGWGCSIYVTLTVLLSFQLQHTVMKWRVAIAAVGLVFAKKALDILRAVYGLCGSELVRRYQILSESTGSFRTSIALSKIIAFSEC